MRLPYYTCIACSCCNSCIIFFFFQAEDGIRDLVRSRGLGDVYKRQRAYSSPATSPLNTCTHAPSLRPSVSGRASNQSPWRTKTTCQSRKDWTASAATANGTVVASRVMRTVTNRPCLLYTSPSPRDRTRSRMPSSA